MLVGTTMAVHKESDKKMDQIRKILDNPYQISTPNNKYESTLRARLLGQQRYQPSSSQTQPINDTLRPMVTIHHAPERKPIQSTPPIEKFEEEKEIPEEIPSETLYLENEDIFEIEPEVSEEIPVFIEVKQKERFTETQTDKEMEEIDEESEEFKNLPKWEPVIDSEKTQTMIKENIAKPETDITKKTQPKEKEIKPAVEEFQEVPTASENDEKPMIWQTVDTSKEKKQKTKKKIFQKAKKDSSGKKTRQKSKFFKSYKKEIDDEDNSDAQQEKPAVKEEMKEPDKSSFSFKNYQLYQKEIDLGNGKKRTIRFFSKDIPDDAIPTTLPDNYEVKINKKTGVPYLRKK